MHRRSFLLWAGAGLAALTFAALPAWARKVPAAEPRPKRPHPGWHQGDIRAGCASAVRRWPLQSA